jgi:ankyrin repeat protein
MLSSFLAEELNKKSAPILARITRPINVLLCFCEGYGSDRTSATEIVGSLLYQLLSQRPTQLGKQFVRQMEHGDRSKLKDFDTLWRIFAATIKNSGAGSTIIIIDGVDLSQDCSASDNYVHRLSGLLSSASQSSDHGRIQAIFTSQRCARIAQEFKNSSTIHLDSPASLEMIQKDLRLVTHQQVQDVIAANRCQDEEKFLVSNLLAKAKSLQEPSQCPLWVTLVTKQLMISPFSSKQTLRQFIDDLPPSLNGLYLHSLNKVSEQFRQEAIYLVSIVLGARRPLTLDELTIAWSMNRVRCTKAPINETREPYIRRTIRSLLGSMVQCVDEKVQIVHDSIRGFLRESKPNGLPSSPFLIQDKAANLELAHDCVGYLLLDDCDVLSEPVSSSEASTLPLTLRQTQQSPASPTLDQGNMKEIEKHNEAKEQNSRSPDEFFEPGFFEPPRLASTSRGRFFDYSALNWISHVSLAGDELATDKNLLESIARLCEKSSPFISNWLPYYHEKLQSWVVLPENLDSLAVAAYFGLEQVVMFILREDDTITQRKKSAALHAALHPASAPARTKMIQLLLEYGAPPDDRDGLNSTPLARAAKAGYDEIVAMLLGTKKVDVNALSTGGRTALSRAVEENHLKVCKLLLDRNDIELDKFEMHGWTPFMAAAENGNLDILRALLHKYNGHLNQQYIPQSKSIKRDEIGRTAISFAAEKGHLGIVQHLLNLGPERVSIAFGSLSLKSSLSLVFGYVLGSSTGPWPGFEPSSWLAIPSWQQDCSHTTPCVVYPSPFGLLEESADFVI